LLIIGVLVSFGLVNENFGGMPTYLGAIIGSSLALALIERPDTDQPFQGMLLPLILIGFTNPVDTCLQREKLKVQTLLQNPETDSGQPAAKKEVMSIPAIALSDGDAGAWKSIAANSKIEFEVGPGTARTSGAIKDFHVDIQLDKAGVLKNILVEMKSASLTTFNSTRDDSVLSDEFINSEEYPEITYRSRKIEKIGEDYKVTGDLEFAGAKAEVIAHMRFVSKVTKDGSEILVFVGKTVVDRTKHNMSSDAKIGDLVDVTFEVAVER
jgi:polyisoprenoid-binding protein YceI